MKILWFPRLQFDIDKLHVTTWREMYSALENNGVSVKIAIAGNDVDNILNLPYIKIPIIKVKFLRVLTFLISGYLKFIWNFLVYKPEVVIFDIYSIWFAFPLSLFSRKNCLFIIDNRTPIYDLMFRATIEDKVMKYYTRLAYIYCRYFLDGMTVINWYYKKQICTDFNFKATDIGVWGSGVNMEIFSPQKYKQIERPSFLKGKFVLMQHGELSVRRGVLETIEAIGLLKNKDIVFVILGEGKAQNKIIQKIKELGLEKRVYVLPAVPYYKVPAYISYCDCAIMAYPDIEYWNNNSPIKLIEYFAMGKPVICTDIWTFRDVAGDKKCAYYIANNNPETIANAINYCSRNSLFLDEWGREGIKIVRERYTWNKQAENLLDFIRHLHNKPKYQS